MTHLQRFNEAFGGYTAGAALINCTQNKTWLSNFEFHDGYVLVTKEQAYIITDFRYAEAAEAEADKAFMVVTPNGLYKEIGEILKRHGVTEVIFEENSLSVASLEAFKSRIEGVEFKSGASALIDSLREC